MIGKCQYCIIKYIIMYISTEGPLFKRLETSPPHTCDTKSTVLNVNYSAVDRASVRAKEAVKRSNLSD